MGNPWKNFKTIGAYETERHGPQRTALSGWLWIVCGMPVLGAAAALLLLLAGFSQGIGFGLKLDSPPADLYQVVIWTAVVGAAVGFVAGMSVTLQGLRHERAAAEFEARRTRRPEN